MLTCTAVAEAAAPSHAFTVKAFRAEPLASAAPFHFSVSPAASKVEPATTACQAPTVPLPAGFHFCNSPVDTASIRKLRFALSTSAALAALARAAKVISLEESSIAPAIVEKAVSVGASLTGLMLKETLWLERVLTFGAVPEPLSITSKMILSVPLAFATVWYVRPANSAAVRVVLAVTAVAPSLLKSKMKGGIAVIL